MNDLVFYGGNHAMEVGSQQFTSRNLTFYKSATAIFQNWDWGWTYIGLTINGCGIGIDMSAGGDQAQTVGSVTLIDSTITNTPIGIKTARTSSSLPTTGGSLAIENVVLNNVPMAVQGPLGVTLAGTTGTTTIGAWVQGNIYTPNGPTNFQGSSTAFPRPASLLSGSKYYARSKPQYQNLPVSSFSSVRSAGAKGDGVTDDTLAIQNAITSATAAGKIVYFDSGIYKVTNVINVPAGAKLVGETYPVIMGSGTFWSDVNNPQPVVRLGSTSGETGSVEWSDMIVSTQGAAPGATLIQWNLASPVTAPSGMWDVHTRIGGFDGSNLQVSQCAKTLAQPNPACYAAFMSMRITEIASGVYMENVWLWTADHDIDSAANTQISIYSGRGLSVESTTGNIWL
jgi:glucan 1,3-beta-glucosidase